MIKIKNLFLLAKNVWISLAIGWSLLLLSPLLPYGLDQGGALLICSVVIAEIYDTQGYRYVFENLLPGTHASFRFVEVDKPDKSGKDIKVSQYAYESGTVTLNDAKNWPIYNMAKESDFRTSRGEKVWIWEFTVSRTESYIQKAMVISAISGTLFWAFGA